MQNWKKKKKKKKKMTFIFQNFGLVGKGQTNIFFFFFRPNIALWKNVHCLLYNSYTPRTLHAAAKSELTISALALFLYNYTISNTLGIVRTRESVS